MRIWIGLTLAVAAAGTTVAATSGDWRKTAGTEQKVERLVEVMPGTADIMMVVGERYNNLYWAGRQGKWEFAAYQLEEIEDLMEKLMITRPQHAALAQQFIEHAIEPFGEAFEHRDWERFSRAFQQLHGQCMACHAQTDHGFIALPAEPKRASSPVLNMP